MKMIVEVYTGPNSLSPWTILGQKYVFLRIKDARKSILFFFLTNLMVFSFIYLVWRLEVIGLFYYSIFLPLFLFLVKNINGLKDTLFLYFFSNCEIKWKRIAKIITIDFFHTILFSFILNWGLRYINWAEFLYF